ncbi:hypothetical protein UUU_35700 [Klebsiella pneumoniae subsp. pneumoniae DSM 30104 = JCM 1662 = NBRC 14940]|nr:hypothetical protein UUU_35700 [Klebsiella pneumoniae subsp. pneumoniae DSM 30104 = JCM 1662 = NBRC 14940]
MSYKSVSSSGILHLTQPLTSQSGRISYQSVQQSPMLYAFSLISTPSAR